MVHLGGPDETAGVDARQAMLRLIRGFQIARAVCVVAELGVADRLRDGPQSIEELAQATGTHAPSLYRLLRGLAAAGIFAMDDSGRCGLTPLGATLRSNVPGSLRAWAVVMLGGAHYRAWGELMHSVKTGEIAFNHLFGMSAWEYRAANSESGTLFNEAMSNLTASNEAIRGSYPFSNLGLIVDVGGGDGSLLTSILEVAQRTRGIVFDLPYVAEAARRRVEAAGLADRCEFIGGDALAAVPAGGDAYLLSRVIHDWDDARSVDILRNCRRAMSRNGVLLLLERVAPARIEVSAGHQMVTMSDLNMMVMNGGLERTEAEFQAIFERAGFTLTRILPAGTPASGNIIEGRPR